jgi:peptidoglycan/LPS O-acetylase OafA/YrhL
MSLTLSANTFAYRKEIEGLRALAVVSVISGHFFPAFLEMDS